MATFAGVLEVTRDLGPNLNAVSEPAPVDAQDQGGGFVDSDHGHNEGGAAYPALDLTALGKVIDVNRAWRSHAVAPASTSPSSTRASPRSTAPAP